MSIDNASGALRPAALRAKDAGAYLGVSPWTVRVLAKRGELPSRLIGRARVFLVQDLDGFLQSRPMEARG